MKIESRSLTLSLGMAWMALLLMQCGGNTSKETPKVYSGATAVGITHSVKDYAAWLAVYKAKSDSEARVSLYVSPDDPNLVTVYMLTTSHADAKEMAASADLKKSMEEAGVTSEPKFIYLDMKYRAQGKSLKKYRVLVQHEVADYDAWKKVFDADEARRTEAGLELRGISINADNPKQVGLMFATEDPEKIKGMIASDELKAKMKEGGVTSEPVVSVMMLPPAN